MRKLAAVIGLLAAVSLASAAPIATTDFYQVSLTGANQVLDLTTHSGSTADAGVASAAWTSGPDLTAVGTVGGNSIWATGWDGTAGDYIKLSVELDASYSAVIEQIRFATRRSGTSPAAATTAASRGSSRASAASPSATSASVSILRIMLPCPRPGATVAIGR